MTIWGKLLGAAAGQALGGPLGALIGAAMGHVLVDRPLDRAPLKPVETQSAAFTIAAIALAAKLSAADGRSSEAEFRTFQRLFSVEPGEAENVARFYRFAQKSPHGFELYASQARDTLGVGNPLLVDLLDCLFMIALADGRIDAQEQAFLDIVAERFALSPQCYAQVKARYRIDHSCPYAVLGLEPDAGPDEIRAAYRQLARQHHPDRHMAEGAPEPFLKVAHARMAAINAAYRDLMQAQAA